MINIEQHLSSDQLEAYRDCKAQLKEVWSRGEHPWQRMAASRDEIQPIEVRDCVPYVLPYDLDAPCAVMHPTPWFVSELMRGGIHPPLSAQLEQKLLIIAESGKSAVVTKLEAPEWRAVNGPIKGEYVVDNRRYLTEVEGPLTYEQAIEYCIMKDIPVAVWGCQHNDRRFVITRKENLPDRSTRGSWKFADMELAV